MISNFYLKKCKNSHCSRWITINNNFPPIPIIYLFSPQHSSAIPFAHSFDTLYFSFDNSFVTRTQPDATVQYSAVISILPFHSEGTRVQFVSIARVNLILWSLTIPCIGWATHLKALRSSAIHVFLVLCKCSFGCIKIRRWCELVNMRKCVVTAVRVLVVSLIFAPNAGEKYSIRRFKHFRHIELYLPGFDYGLQ